MNPLETISKYWQIIIFVFGVAITWSKMQTTDKDHEKRISAVESKQEALNPTLLQMQIDIAEIKTVLKIHYRDQ